MLLPDEFVYGYGKNKETDAKYFIAYKTGKKNQTITHQASKNELILQQS